MKPAGWAWRRRAPLLVSAVLFLVVNVAFFLWYRGTARDRARGLEARRVALEAEVASQERETEKLESQRQRLSQVSAAIDEFSGRRVGSRRETLAALVDEIHGTLNRIGIKTGEIAYETAPVPDLPLTQMTVRFGFQADYAKLKRLLDAFETGRRWIVVREVALTRDPETPGGIQVRVALATYFSREPGETEAPRRVVAPVARGVRG